MRNKIFLFLFLISTPVLANETVDIAPLTTSVKASTTTVAGTAVAVPTTALVGRSSIAIRNTAQATETIACGDSTVTYANGFILDSVTPSITLDVDDSVVTYCISDGTSVDVRTIEAK